MDKLNIVRVVLVPLIFPIEDNDTAKLLSVPVASMITVPLGFPFAPKVTIALVVYILNPTKVTPPVSVVVVATTVCEDPKLL